VIEKIYDKPIETYIQCLQKAVQDVRNLGMSPKLASRLYCVQEHDVVKLTAEELEYSHWCRKFRTTYEL